MNTFDDLLTEILKAVEENPSSNVDEVIAKKVAEMGLSEEGVKTLEETNSYLEAYNEMYEKLRAAKESGESRVAWIQDELLLIADKHQLTDEQKEQLIADVSAACDDALKTTLKEGE